MGFRFVSSLFEKFTEESLRSRDFIVSHKSQRKRSLNGALYGLGYFGCCFYGISTLVGHLMPNPVYTLIKYISFVNKYIVRDILTDPELISLHTVK